MEIILIIVNVVLAVGIYLIYEYLKQLPSIHKDLIVEDRKHINSKELQKEAYYKDLSGNTLEKLLKTWTGYIVNIESLSKLNEQRMSQLKIDTLMYGSTKTVNDFSKYMNLAYYGKDSYEENLTDEEHSFLSLILFAQIICDLKYDFTGYEISPETILEIQIKDYKEMTTPQMINKINEIAEKM